MLKTLSVISASLVCVLPANADERPPGKLDAGDVEFFEAKIRPVLVKHCYECHSAESKTVQGGLLLDNANNLLHGGDSGAGLVPGKPEDSLLLSALKYEAFEMPPKKRLPESVVADFESWIKRGAVDPRKGEHTPTAEAMELDIELGRQFWAFQEPQRSTAATSIDHSKRIDELVQQELAENQINPNEAASRRILLRRLSYDITGLPPASEQLQQFIADKSESALATQVDRLLDSSRYGERWARLWLDVTRYAEDQAHIVGNNKSLFFPNAYRYRDWVIKSLNEDMPYDRFVNLQLAGDILEPESEEHTAALGFIGVGPKYYRRNDPEVMADEWEDRVDVVMRGLQGLTVACARCHDHKYDPVTTEDYYAIAGVFAGTEMFNKPLSKDVKASKNGHAKNPDQSLHVVRDSQPTNLAVMIRGDVDNKGDIVPRGFIQVAFPGPRRSFQNGSGRAELAKCLTDPTNPLTARVIVNRIWQQFFGRGIVSTTSNFGKLGERPSHPELLDDLAVGFVNNGWSLKWLQRQIVLSDTYQRSSIQSADAIEKDPTNTLLWRMPRRRLSVEGWRDSVLAVSGKLSKQIGGPSMKPDDPTQNRRTIYSKISRFQLNPLLSLFDFPDPNVHASRRLETNTPLQKLFLLNSDFLIAQTDNIFAKLEPTTSPKQNVMAIFQMILQRQPDADELAKSVAYLKAHPTNGTKDLIHVTLASNEFWFVD